jgi:hypothetical protein
MTSFQELRDEARETLIQCNPGKDFSQHLRLRILNSLNSLDKEITSRRHEHAIRTLAHFAAECELAAAGIRRRMEAEDARRNVAL